MTDTQQPADGATPEAGDAGAMPAAVAPAVPPTDASGATPPSESSSQLEAALKRERDARKQAEAELKKLRPQADSAEGLVARVAELEAAKAAAEREAMLQKVMHEHSVPSVLRDRLHGQTESELAADAAALMAALPAPQQPPATQTTTSVAGPQGPPVAAKRSPEEWASFVRSKR